MASWTGVSGDGSASEPEDGRSRVYVRIPCATCDNRARVTTEHARVMVRFVQLAVDVDMREKRTGKKKKNAV